MLTTARLAERLLQGYAWQCTLQSVGKNSMKDCKVCLVQHDDEIHAATINVRTWFHQQVTQGFYEEPQEVALGGLEPDSMTIAVA
jgi:hypothetical protein